MDGNDKTELLAEISSLKNEITQLKSQKRNFLGSNWKAFPSKDFYVALSLGATTLTFILELISGGITQEQMDSLQQFVDIAIQLSQEEGEIE